MTYPPKVLTEHMFPRETLISDNYISENARKRFVQIFKDHIKRKKFMPISNHKNYPAKI